MKKKRKKGVSPVFAYIDHKEVKIEVHNGWLLG